MKTLLTLTLVVLLAGSAMAQFPNSMGIFFDENDFAAANTNFNPNGTDQFEAYLVVVNPTLGFVGGYECSLAISDPAVVVLGWGGPDAFWNEGSYAYPEGFTHGGTNFGDYYNHVVGYAIPLMTYGNSAVLSKLRLEYMGTDMVEIMMGAANPSSVAGAGPAMANGIDPNDLVVCTYTSGPDFGGLVATLNGAGIEFPVATEGHSWSGVKALFD